METTTQPTIGASRTFSRDFDAPRDLVWKVNTEAEHMAKWFAPAGFDAFVKTMDFRPGGMCHYGQRSPQGFTMWGRVVYKEIQPKDRIVQIQSFSDEDGGITAPPMMPVWPQEMLSTITFTDLGGDRTRMAVEWAPYNATPEQQRVFEEAMAGMQQGWGGTFDKLAGYLASHR